MLKPAIKFAWRHFPFKLPILRMIRAFGSPPHWLYQHLHFVGDFDVEVAPGARFTIRSFGHEVENALFWTGYRGSRERVSMHIWSELARDADVVMDVGANTGVFALAAAALNPRATVIAFEPVVRVNERLRENVALNGGRIVVEDFAVSDREGVATLHDVDSDHVYSASLNRSMLGDTYTRSYEVRTTGLDAYCSAHAIERVDLAKIDVERHEPAVIRGFREMLAKHRPALLIEILDDEILASVKSELDGIGYQIFDLSNLAPAPGLPMPVPGYRERNYLVCSAEVAERLGLRAGAVRDEIDDT